MDERKAKLEWFKERTWITFYRAVEEHFFDIDDETKLLAIFDDEWLEKATDEQFEKIFKAIDSIVDNRYVWAKDKRIAKWFEYSQMRWLWFNRKISTWWDYDIMSAFVDEDKIRYNLCHNNAIAFNPYFLVNRSWCPDECRCIFKPSKRIQKLFKFLEPVYNKPKTRIIWYKINVDLLRHYDRIDLRPEDIEYFYWWMYHPYLRGLVQNNLFTWLIRDEQKD